MLEIEQRKLSRFSNGHNISLGCSIRGHNISRRSKMNNGSSRVIQKVITFHLEVRFKRIIYRDTQNWTRKLSANSSDRNFWVGCMIDADDISRCSKLNNGSSRELQMVITFHSEVRFRRIIYRDTQIWTRKLLANSNGHNCWLGCMIEANYKLTHSKKNKGSSREIQMVITFHSEVRFRRIIYRDTQNWTQKLSENSNGHNIWLGCMIEANFILRGSKLKNGSSREIQMVITF